MGHFKKKCLFILLINHDRVKETKKEAYIKMLIKIVRVPEGEAPEEIRKEWVGCELPITDFARLTPTNEVLSGVSRIEKGFSVHAFSALAILRKKSREAAAWFENHMRLTTDDYLFFNENECKITSYEVTWGN